MMATLATVRIVLLMNARTSRQSRVCEHRDEVVEELPTRSASVNSRSDASAGVLPAVRKMNANGTMNTTIDDEDRDDADDPHCRCSRCRFIGSTSFRLSSHESGMTMIAVTTRNSTTLPAVESP